MREWQSFWRESGRKYRRQRFISRKIGKESSSAEIEFYSVWKIYNIDILEVYYFFSKMRFP